MSAAAEQKNTEPSMEEILASIRRIISDDQKPEPLSSPSVQTSASTSTNITSVPASQVRDRVDHSVSTIENKTLPEIPDMDEDVLELTAVTPETKTDATGVHHNKFEAVSLPLQPQSFPEIAAKPSNRLIEGQTDQKVANSFNTLAHTVLSQNARTLDDVVKDMLHPMLKSWLDNNLPTIVERLVRAEIERVARGGR